MTARTPPSGSGPGRQPAPADAASPSTALAGPLDAEWAWRAVLDRDRRADGRFVYAVRSTRIYCRPSCPSRRPRRDRVELFAGPSAARLAESAGYRACRRCRPSESDDAPHARDAIVGRAQAILDEADGRITLAELADRVGITPSRLQRDFTRALGISPREYQETRRMERLRERLRGGGTVSAATYEAGFSGPRRVYERAAATLGMSPGAYRRGGAGVEVRWATGSTSLGELLVAITDRGLCAITLGDDRESLLASLREELPRATLLEDAAAADRWLRAATRLVEAGGNGNGERMHAEREPALDVGGTDFQQRVWRELRRIPAGETRTYTELAAAIGQPTAVRAVARACASNRAAVLIPCHRVVRGDGSLGGYRWGVERKRALLERERGGGESAR